MKKETKEILPEWYKKMGKYNIRLGNDFDSLFGSILLRNIFKSPITEFYNFNTLYVSSNNTSIKEVVGVDMSTKGKNFDNHVQKVYFNTKINKESININNILEIQAGGDEYFNKYNLSTTLLILSLYDVELPKNEEALMLLLVIDSSWQSYHSPYKRDNAACKKYLVEILELPELYAVLERHTKEEFSAIKKKYNLNAVIKVNKDGKLETAMNLFYIWMALGFHMRIDCNSFQLPEDTFGVTKQFDNRYMHRSRYLEITKLDKEIFSLAVTRKDWVSLSVC